MTFKMIRNDWNKLLDKYLNEGKMHSEEYAELNEIQKTIIQEIKKSIKRINYGKQN